MSLFDAKEQVRQATDIVDLVGSYMELRRQGRVFVGRCPWHEDRRPSLQVNPERQSFKCWVCDIGGDVFSFLMKMEQVSFPEALEMLAERANITLDKQAFRPKTVRIAADPSEAVYDDDPTGGMMEIDKPTLLQAAAWAEKQYEECLLEMPEAEPARQYLADRGIVADDIRRFHLGFSPETGNWLLAKVRNDPKRAKILEALGILVRRDGGGWYDRFHGRVLFSIRDSQGRPVGIGGRILPGSEHPAKYVNSPETLLFSKSSLLYGLDVAKETMRRSHRALVMEGYTDCIAAHQHGFTDAVAVLGTALGERHITTLRRFADQVVLVLDGDEAGRKRAGEVLELFLAQEVDLRLVTLPEGKDPCEFLQQYGAEAFAQFVDGASDALEHAFLATTRNIDLQNDLHGAAQALERMVALIAKAPRGAGLSRLREDMILNRLAHHFRVPEEDVRKRLTEARRKAQPRITGPAPAGPELPAVKLGELYRRDPFQTELLEILVQFPDLLTPARERFSIETITLAPLRAIFAAMGRLADEGYTPEFARLMVEFDEPAMKSLLVELDESPRIKKHPDPARLLEELIANFQKRRSRMQDPKQVVALRDEGLDQDRKTQMLGDMLKSLRARQGIADSTDGAGPGPGTDGTAPF